MKFTISYLYLFIIGITLLQLTIEDLPVHCLAAKIEGDWLIHMTDNYSDKDLKCGHNTPDQNLDHFDVNVEKTFKRKHQIIVSIQRPNLVLSINDSQTEVGKWTMVYDEGFEFTISDQVFFSFSRYQKTGKFSASNTDTEDTPGYTNLCDKTFIGWYHNQKTNENWGCFWAEKIESKVLKNFDTRDINYSNVLKLSQIPIKSTNVQSDVNSSTSISKKNNNFIKKQTTKSNSDIFSLLNELNISQTDKQEKQDSNKNNNIERESLEDFNNIGNYKSTYNNIDPPGFSSSSEIKIPAKEKSQSSTNKLENNSYVDFVKSLGWDNSNGGNYNNIPHLDIYFFDNSESSGKSNNFLELEEKTKYFTPDYNFLNKVNDPKNGFLWKAKVYDDFVGKTYSQMRNLLGNSNIFKSMSIGNSNESDFLELEVEMKNTEKEKAQSKSHFDKLPENFDWRNVDGTNYDSPIRKQGECGSCYSIAAVSVLETRIRIKSNNRLKPLLSPSSIISCSRYNQGCAGGYPYLVGKFGKEFGFVEESCQPYSESDDKCYNYCFHEKAWKIKEYGYVGGYYGGCDEESMMREIYEHGPIVVAINASPELYYYSNGIFHSDVKKTEGKNEKGVRPWEYTNHAVVCLGWGEEVVNDNVVKYWILKNSWGETWGEKGYFKLNKGVNMASVEAQGVYMRPDLD